MKLTATALGLCVTAALLAGCGGGDDDPGSNEGGESQYADGGTFTLALKGDPGNLDPHSSAGTQLFTVSQFGYDNLVTVDEESGEIRPQLVKEWSVDDTTVTLTLNEGITCSDGSDFTATTVADNIAYVADPKNKSPFLGTFLPVGATAEADDAAGTVTITLAEPAPFVLNGLASLSMVCDAGLQDRESLADSTAGTGPYELTEAVPGEQYTYQIRDDYTWGPDGATTAEEGMPDTVVMKIVENEGTAANLLGSGEVNAAQIQGPDVERLEAQDLFVAETPALVGEQWYNHNDGHASSDPEVRMALTQALDLAELASVSTADAGTPATTLAVIEPASLPGRLGLRLAPGPGRGGGEGRALRPAGADLPLLERRRQRRRGRRRARRPAVGGRRRHGDREGRRRDRAPGCDLRHRRLGHRLGPAERQQPRSARPVPVGSGRGRRRHQLRRDRQPRLHRRASRRPARCPESRVVTPGSRPSPHWSRRPTSCPSPTTMVKTFGNGAEFETPGQLVPTSIRMLAE